MKILISVVNHGHDDYIHSLLKSFNPEKLALEDAGCEIKFLITHNLPCYDDFLIYGDHINLLVNTHSLSFGVNHNKAFMTESSDIFIVCNPDVLYFSGSLIEICNVAISQKKIISPFITEDCKHSFDPGRRKPSFKILLIRFLSLFLFATKSVSKESFSGNPDWVPGVFMIFPGFLFREVKGFDERIFMYYEDADICRRARNIGFSVNTSDSLKIMHHVGRASRKSFRLFYHHIFNAFRVGILGKWHSSNHE
jgi:GT2 family glycosyltransferase